MEEADSAEQEVKDEDGNVLATVSKETDSPNQRFGHIVKKKKEVEV